MDSLEVLEFSLHKVSVNEKSPIELALDGDAADLENYANIILDELLDSSRSRYFQFKDMNELVAGSLVRIIEGEDWAEESARIAGKLFDVEIEVQDEIKGLKHEVRVGCLLQLKIKHDETIKFVIVKIDDDEFFDERELKLRSGLPASKSRLQKAAVVTFAQDSSIDELVLSDSKSTITPYWYMRFLMAEQLKNSETNTKNAFNAIDKLLNKEVKAVSTVDYWFLRNEIINHFRNEESLAYDELVEKVKKHKPEKEEFKEKFDNFVDKFVKLPTTSSKPFDTQFELAPNTIRARIVRTVTLDENFELRLKANVKDLSSRIKAEIDAKGKHLKIYTDHGYEQFKTSENE